MEIRTRYTSPDGRRHFDLVRTPVETYIQVEGQDVVDHVHDWTAQYVAQGWKPGQAA